MRGRRPKQESRAEEFRQQLIDWRRAPEFSRPSLRALARELGTSHQLLGHYLSGLEAWSGREDLLRLRATAKAKNVTLTAGCERRYLKWLRKIEEDQARAAAKAARWADKHAAVLETLKAQWLNSRR
jgi:transcriptional regulator with XRE-family HTH domain